MDGAGEGTLVAQDEMLPTLLQQCAELTADDAAWTTVEVTIYQGMDHETCAKVLAQCVRKVCLMEMEWRWEHLP
jgi:hypothetical protein